MKALEQKVFVICEIGIQIVNLDTFKKEKSFLFDEIIKDVNLTGHIMNVSFLNEEDVEIDLKTKTIYDC